MFLDGILARGLCHLALVDQKWSVAAADFTLKYKTLAFLSPFRLVGRLGGGTDSPFTLLEAHRKFLRFLQGPSSCYRGRQQSSKREFSISTLPLRKIIRQRPLPLQPHQITMASLEEQTNPGAASRAGGGWGGEAGPLAV